MGEAVFYLLWYSFLINMMPFRWWESNIGKKMQPLNHEEIDSETILLIKQVRRAVFRANKLLWGLGKCFAISLSMKKMLKKLGIESTLYLGVYNMSYSNIYAHAWLNNNIAIYGENNSKSKYIQLIAFT